MIRHHCKPQSKNEMSFHLNSYRDGCAEFENAIEALLNTTTSHTGFGFSLYMPIRTGLCDEELKSISSKRPMSIHLFAEAWDTLRLMLYRKTHKLIADCSKINHFLDGSYDLNNEDCDHLVRLEISQNGDVLISIYFRTDGMCTLWIHPTLSQFIEYQLEDTTEENPVVEKRKRLRKYSCKTDQVKIYSSPIPQIRTCEECAPASFLFWCKK